MFRTIPLLVLALILTACTGSSVVAGSDSGTSTTDVTAADIAPDALLPDALILDAPATDTPTMEISTDSPGLDSPSDTPAEAVSDASTDQGADVREQLRPGLCRVDGDCDDQVPCTSERCMDGHCLHAPLPARCAPRETCDPVRGCSAGRACAGDQDCTDSDPCTLRERCDSAARVCLHDVLDGDGDDDPPRSCGGGDCDDNNYNLRTRLPEFCNGRDDNCNGMTDESPVNCGRGTTCQMGSCICTLVPSSEIRRGVIQYCGNPTNTNGSFICTDVRSDNRACGETCYSCPSVTTCMAGRCICNDPALTLCGGVSLLCVDLRTDMRHCGRCGNACPMDATGCVNGVCQCPAGRPLCTSRGANECFDPAAHQNDNDRCGACDNTCPPNARCSGGRCVCNNPGWVVCNGICTSLDVDTGNCGRCGTMCPDTTSCVMGTCRCRDEETMCSDGCRDLDNDFMNCGRCGRVCQRVISSGSPYAFCDEGECLCRPSTGSTRQLWCMTDLGEECVSVDSNNAHCGRCGRACSAGQRCVEGACR